MNKCVLCLLLAGLLCLSGCGSMLNREYSSVEPHSSTYYEDADRSVLRAENYQDMVNDLLLLVAGQAKDGTIWYYPGEEESDAAMLADLACHEVQQETPMGAYAVDYLTYTIDHTPRNYVSIHLTIGYRRTAEQIDAIVHITSISALQDLLTAAVRRGDAELTVQLSYFENQQQEVRDIVTKVGREHGAATDWEVYFYPESGDAGIIEIILKK